jgi:phosphoglycolate phosphatase
MKSMIKLVIFDLDGTIGDTIPLCISAFKNAIEPHIMRDLPEEEIRQTFGADEEGTMKQIAGENWKKALNDFYIHYSRLHYLCPAPFDGIVELIRKLRKQSVLTALVTGKGKSCYITLDKFNIRDCFDSIETGSPHKNRKHEAIGGLLDKYRLKPDEALYVGDTVSDVFSCKKAGIVCLSAAWAKNVSTEELEAVNAGNVIRSVAGLEERLHQL